MTTPREDALTQGARLKAKMQTDRESRINRALGTYLGQAPLLGSSQAFRHQVAERLYHARFDGRPYWEEPSKETVLEDFLADLFGGCNLEEVIEAWDRYLG